MLSPLILGSSTPVFYFYCLLGQDVTDLHADDFKMTAQTNSIKNNLNYISCTFIVALTKTSCKQLLGNCSSIRELSWLNNSGIILSFKKGICSTKHPERTNAVISCILRKDFLRQWCVFLHGDDLIVAHSREHTESERFAIIEGFLNFTSKVIWVVGKFDILAAVTIIVHEGEICLRCNINQRVFLSYYCWHVSSVC